MMQDAVVVSRDKLESHRRNMIAFLFFVLGIISVQAFVAIDPILRISEDRQWNRFPSLAGHPLQTNNDPDDFPLFLLPFPVNEALSIGQKRSILLKDGRFLDLVQDSVDEHSSMLGMALMGDDALLSMIVICKIAALQVDAGFRGRVTVQATLEAVGRGSLVELLQLQPTMKARCAKVTDTVDEMGWEECSLLRKEIEQNIGELGLAVQYERALSYVVHEELATGSDAACWAVFSTLPDSPLVVEALTSTSPLKRLGLATQALREEKARSSLIDFNSKYE